MDFVSTIDEWRRGTETGDRAELHILVPHAEAVETARELATAIKRARHLGLLPYVVK